MVDVDYADGKVCLAGTITTNEWGAVYSLTFAPGDGENSWNAASRGVAGFELGISGSYDRDSLHLHASGVRGDRERA